MMTESRVHSFEDASSTDNRDVQHHMPLTSNSRSDSSQHDEPIKSIDFPTIHFPHFESRPSAQGSHSLKLNAEAPRISRQALRRQSSKTSLATSPERGRSRLRSSPTSEAARKTYASSASPDRFIPKRDFADLSSHSFRVNKHPQQLTPEEKLLRRRLPGYDPFLSHPSPVQPPQEPTVTSRHGPYHRPHLVTGSAVTRSHNFNGLLRNVSLDTVWSVGGASAVRGDSATVDSSDVLVPGRHMAVPSYAAKFIPKTRTIDEQTQHESRLALALDIDPTARLLGTCTTCVDSSPSPTSSDYERLSPFLWKDSAWKKVEREHWPLPRCKREIVPSRPFRILDAPGMKDDFYCSNLAYSITSDVLAVGLGHGVYLWSESHEVTHPSFEEVRTSDYVTSLSFSSEDGCRSILAVGRKSGLLTLWAVPEAKPRFEISHPSSVSCVSFRPKTTRRPSERFAYMDVEVEELVVGDEIGNIWYYSVEWPEIRNRWSWTGSMTLLARVFAHTQQICALAWSPDDLYLATGGNDNACLLFELNEITPRPVTTQTSPPTNPTEHFGGPRTQGMPPPNFSDSPRYLFNRHHVVRHIFPSWIQRPPFDVSPAIPLLCRKGTLISGSGRTLLIPLNRQRYHLPHAAAVKAIAFAPWQPTLLATGGGTNDRLIHFYHTRSGTCLATINVFAQVTCLIWSQTRREIVATFGFTHPDHPIRIAVFAWPSCAQVAVIPWGPYGTCWDGPPREVNWNCGRALWAVSYPGRPPRPISPPLFESEILETFTPPSSPASPSSEGPTQTSERRSESRGRSLGARAVSPKEKEGGLWCTRTMEEGCIIVASSDQTIKFHEVWTGRRKSAGSASGLLGGSDILEGIEGIEKSSSEVIR